MARLHVIGADLQARDGINLRSPVEHEHMLRQVCLRPGTVLPDLDHAGALHRTCLFGDTFHDDLSPATAREESVRRRERVLRSSFRVGDPIDATRRMLASELRHKLTRDICLREAEDVPRD